MSDDPNDRSGADDGGAAVAKDATASLPARLWASFRGWTHGAPLSRGTSIALGLVLPGLLLALNMWRVRSFTVDDSYISFRYARNLARGDGLVYNPGERIEGYTNFLWTVLLAGGIRCGLDPNKVAKLLGALCAFSALGFTYAIADRLKPYRTLPCVATWLLATTIVFSGYAVFGLETSFFVCLILAGTLLFFEEVGALFQGQRKRGPPARGNVNDSDDLDAFPYSGIVFALAGLTRPEAPMFAGILMLFLGRRIVGRQNLVRAALFAVPILAHLAFRRAYYGEWVPNTLGAKTGNLDGQLAAGWAYLDNYAKHAGSLLWLAVFGAAVGIARWRRDILAVTAVVVAVSGYVYLVGGDWMPFFRFMAPFEPFCFLLVDLGARSIVDRRERAPTLALAAFALVMVFHRDAALKDAQTQFMLKEKRFWEMATRGTARWFRDHPPGGEIAMGDIGYVGYATDYPILDLLGLVDPVISRLPGGYTQKLGPGFVARFFDRSPEFFLLISSKLDCHHPSVIGSQIIYNDPRFLTAYDVGGVVELDGGFAWCIYRKRQ